jgi:hypothetical protein
MGMRTIRIIGMGAFGVSARARPVMMMSEKYIAHGGEEDESRRRTVMMMSEGTWHMVVMKMSRGAGR